MVTLVIDGNFLAHRAQYSMGSLEFDGEGTGVIFGVLTEILNLGLFFETNDIIFCWDSRHSYRKKIFPGYKEKRRVMDPQKRKDREAVQKQIKRLRKKILPKIGWNNQLLQAGVESDDLMASVVFNKLGEFMIVTSDQDLYQCLLRNVRLWNPAKKQLMTVKKFQKEYVITPDSWRYVKAIGGCKSDSVPGVRGVGEGSAIKYMMGDLEESSSKYVATEKAIKNGEMDLYLKLVTLPYPKTKEPEIVGDSLTMEGLMEVCEECGLDSFLEKEKMREWKTLFKMGRD